MSFRCQLLRLGDWKWGNRHPLCSQDWGNRHPLCSQDWGLASSQPPPIPLTCGLGSPLASLEPALSPPQNPKNPKPPPLICGLVGPFGGEHVRLRDPGGGGRPGQGQGLPDAGQVGGQARLGAHLGVVFNTVGHLAIAGSCRKRGGRGRAGDGGAGCCGEVRWAGAGNRGLQRAMG